MACCCHFAVLLLCCCLLLLLSLLFLAVFTVPGRRAAMVEHALHTGLTLRTHAAEAYGDSLPTALRHRRCRQTSDQGVPPRTGLESHRPTRPSAPPRNRWCIRTCHACQKQEYLTRPTTLRCPAATRLPPPPKHLGGGGDRVAAGHRSLFWGVRYSCCCHHAILTSASTSAAPH